MKRLIVIALLSVALGGCYASLLKEYELNPPLSMLLKEHPQDATLIKKGTPAASPHITEGIDSGD